MTGRIQRAIDTFLDAVNNGTLVKGTCTACAVGNLVAKGMGGTISKFGNTLICNKTNQIWGHLFSTTANYQTPSPLLSFIRDDPEMWEKIIENIEATEFTEEELKKIEYAFETNTSIYYKEYKNYTAGEIRADQIRGLEAVVKVMLEFDKQSDKVAEVFTEKALLIPINS